MTAKNMIGKRFLWASLRAASFSAWLATLAIRCGETGVDKEFDENFMENYERRPLPSAAIAAAVLRCQRCDKQIPEGIFCDTCLGGNPLPESLRSGSKK